MSAIDRGNAALRSGDWAAARDAFRSALEEGDHPEALYGMGEALWWLGDMDGTITRFEEAYAVCRREAILDFAAAVAVRLGFHYKAHLANAAAAAGWLGRAGRLIEEHGIDSLRGDLLLMKAYCADDPATGEEWARDAFELARRAEDLDLELCALSQIGVSLIDQGRIDEGIALLDEAMAGSLGGESGRLETVVFTSCNMMVSCARCAALKRAMEWVRAAERFSCRHGCPFLYVECRTVYGAVLAARGDWAEAEQELKEAISLARDSVPAYHADALAALAELRLDQGRIEEAERLLDGLRGHGAALPVRARIDLLREKPARAAAELQRRLEAVGRNRLESVVLLELLGEAEIAQGDPESAVERGRMLANHGRDVGCELAVARGERLWGHALSFPDGRAAADGRMHLDAGLDGFISLGMPFDVARTRFLIAQATRRLEPDVAVTEARAALEIFEMLGAAGEVDRTAALLRELGVVSARARPKGNELLTKREREVLAVLKEGLSNPEIAERLFISRKTVEHHVSSILSKLGLKNRAEAAAEAVRLGSESARK